MPWEKNSVNIVNIPVYWLGQQQISIKDIEHDCIVFQMAPVKEWTFAEVDRV